MRMEPGKTHSFEPPGPGSWALDATHFTRPVTRFTAEIFPREFARGFGEGLKHYGLLLESLDYQFMDGVPYFCLRAVGAPPEATGHPPREVWDQLAASHPEIRARLATSAVALAEKRWRADLELWDREVKPAAVREQLALQAVDPSRMADDALLAHLDRCRENAKQQVYRHHRFNVPALLPVGDFLAHAQDWTGRPVRELLGLLRGTSKVSLGAADELGRAAEAIRADRQAQALLASAGAPRDVLASLEALPDEAGAAVRAYVDLVGYRLVNGLDVGEPYALEMPEVLVQALRAAATARVAPESDQGGPVAEIRDQVPGAHRQEFDDLLAEARHVYRLRDERAIYGDIWAYGLARRAMLVAGERLAQTGRLGHPAEFVEAGYEEMVALIRGTGGPTSTELARRARHRTETSYADVPAFLGPPPGGPLPAEWLPPAAARAERAIGLCIQAILITPPARTEVRTVRGAGASPGVYEGPARLVRGTADFARILQGDVLVTSSTSAAFNLVLPMLGAIVTDRGGLLSHAAIVAREYGVPSVVGCTDATRQIRDGARVRVDGRAGEVTILP
jgi:phosphohistidine swiveling domain-containing protein